jgi:hypothetical protein
VVENRVFTAGESKAFWGTYTLQTLDTVTVQSGADVRFLSGGIIRLAPGFSIQAGGVFNAKISSSPGYDPGGFYNGQSPSVAPLSPHVIYGAAGEFNNQVLDVAVWNVVGSAPLPDAPVLVYVESGGAWLSTAASGAPLVKSLELTADSLGTVQIYIKQPPEPGMVSIIRVVAGGSTYALSTQSYDAAIPDDADPDNDSTDESFHHRRAQFTAGARGLLGDACFHLRTWEARSAMVRVKIRVPEKTM